MPINIPYTFTAGTKAKANEVNENFQALEEFVDALETDVTSMVDTVEALETGKANLNGSADEKFAMADPVSNYDGVNLRTFKDLTANTKDAVAGFVVSKQSNTSIYATAGACWDTSYTKMIASNTSLTKNLTGLSANATYYVYVIMDADTEEVSLTISTSSVTPEVTTGVYYRRLAQLFTDANGYIDYIINDHTSSNSTAVVKAPDYSSRIARSINHTYTADSAGWVFASGTTGDPGDNGQTVYLYINSLLMGGVRTWKYDGQFSWVVPVSRGDTYRISADGIEGRAVYYYFVPCKG